MPQSVCKLLEVRERIKKAYPTKKEWEGPKSSAAEGGTSKKRMVSFSNQIPKKSCKKAKHCALCKKHGCMQNTHNTGDCKKYNSDGTPKKGFAWKITQCNSCNECASHEQNNSMRSCLQKLLNLKNPTGNSSSQTKNASAI